jgi:uncharacterized membrane protein
MRSKGFPLIVIVMMLAFSAAVYNQLPEQVPSHWNFQGQVDRYQPRFMAVIFLPALVLFTWVLREALPRIDPKRADYSQFEGTWRLVFNGTAVVLGLLHVVTLGFALGWQINITRWVGVLVGILFMLIGNEMRRIQPNWFFGIRTPWTLSDPIVWRETHTFGGRIFFGFGLAVLIGAFLRPEVFASVVIGGVLIVTGGSFVYSYLRYRNLHPDASA